MKHNAHYASCKFNKRHEEMSLALKWYIKNNRLRIGEVSKANAPFDAFMQDFSSSLRNDNFASVAAAVFPTLGILGTFISIALSMPDFSSQSSAKVLLAMGGRSRPSVQPDAMPTIFVIILFLFTKGRWKIRPALMRYW